MNIEELRDFCISKKAVEESTPFGPDTLVFKVVGKVFLIVGMDSQPLQFNVKCNPEKAIELREAYICVKPGFHMNKKHWNTIIVDGSVSDQLIESWINDSYNLIVSKLTKNEKMEYHKY